MVKAQPFFHLSAWVSGFPDVAVSNGTPGPFFWETLTTTITRLTIAGVLGFVHRGDHVVGFGCDNVVRAVFRLVQVCLRVGRGETLCETLKIRKRCFVW